ncbi:MAG: outer membrane beta-barrel protein [Saprospiraceae bacterium]
MKSVLTSLFLCLAFMAHAQLKGGFKTGLNFASFSGESEMDAAGNSLEKWENVTGFHIGATFSYHFSDNLGLRGELLYSKKGARYTYEGQGFRLFNYSGGSTYTTGNSIYRINVTNSYLDIPIMGFARVGDFEFAAGGYASLLLSSIGEGSLTYSNGMTEQNPGFVVNELKFILDHNYGKDSPGTGDSRETIVANLPTQNLELPRFLGAYYDLPEDRGNLYNSVDFGLIGGVSYYLSRALYANVRVQYGLADLTNNDADASKANSNNGAPIYRNDKDVNFTIQASVGFNF